MDRNTEAGSWMIGILDRNYPPPHRPCPAIEAELFSGKGPDMLDLIMLDRTPFPEFAPYRCSPFRRESLGRSRNATNRAGKEKSPR